MFFLNVNFKHAFSQLQNRSVHYIRKIESIQRSGVRKPSRNAPGRIIQIQTQFLSRASSFRFKSSVNYHLLCIQTIIGMCFVSDSLWYLLEAETCDFRNRNLVPDNTGKHWKLLPLSVSVSMIDFQILLMSVIALEFFYKHSFLSNMDKTRHFLLISSINFAETWRSGKKPRADTYACQF